MSRTSARVSRPLIAVLAVVVVLGVFFTVHKLRNSRAAEARNIVAEAQPPQPAALPQAPVVPQPEAKPTVAEKPPSPTTEPSHPSPDADALVTQTPTAFVPTASPPATQPSDASLSTQHSALSTNSQARNDLPDLSSRKVEKDDTDTIPEDFLARARANSTSTTPPQISPGAPGQSAISNTPLQDAKTKVEAGDLIASRQLLNDALVTGRMSDTDAEAARKQIEEINKTLVFSARRFPADPWASVYQVASGERLATIAARSSVSWELLGRVNSVTPRRLRAGQSIKIFKGPFHAVVYKKLFRMEIYLGAPGGPGSLYITSYPVGLGKDDSTPTGLWLCKSGDKVRNPRYFPPRGGEVIEASDPKNPLGGYWIALEGQEGQALGKESYGIHGTIEPDSIGKQQSMGCIRLRSEDISWVFDLLVDGKSKVLVKD